MSDTLINKGVTVLGTPATPDAPVVVVGTARGGTSMVAGALAHLGVFMGDAAVAPVYEDTRLSAAFESADDQAVEAILERYASSAHRVGWKRPSSIDQLERVDRLFGKPRYVFVFKDVFAIANRNSISMRSETLSGMARALEQYQRVVEFLRKAQPSALLVSYDKAMAYKHEFIQSLVEFCGIEVSEAQRQAALDFIDPEPAAYLDASRITKAQGRLDMARDNVVAGWARYLHQSKSATVDIYVNDTQVGSVHAREQRRDLVERLGVACGFTFALPSELSPGDIVRARVHDEVRDLANSPFTVV